MAFRTIGSRVYEVQSPVKVCAWARGLVGVWVGEASHPGPTILSLFTALEIDPLLVTDASYKCTRERCHQAWRDWSAALDRVPDVAQPHAGELSDAFGRAALACTRDLAAAAASRRAALRDVDAEVEDPVTTPPVHPPGAQPGPCAEVTDAFQDVSNHFKASCANGKPGDEDIADLVSLCNTAVRAVSVASEKFIQNVPAGLV